MPFLLDTKTEIKWGGHQWSDGTGLVCWNAQLTHFTSYIISHYVWKALFIKACKTWPRGIWYLDLLQVILSVTMVKTLHDLSFSMVCNLKTLEIDLKAGKAVTSHRVGQISHTMHFLKNCYIPSWHFTDCPPVVVILGDMAVRVVLLL